MITHSEKYMTTVEKNLAKEKRAYEIKQERQRNQFMSFLSDDDNYYHLTLTFPLYTNDNSATTKANKLLNYLNNKLFRKKCGMGTMFLRGHCIREFQKNTRTAHFHMIIKYAEKIQDIDEFKSLVQKQLYKIDRNICFKRDEAIQKYSNEGGNNKLERYLTKQFEQSSQGLKILTDNYSVIGKDGIIFDKRNYWFNDDKYDYSKPLR